MKFCALSSNERNTSKVLLNEDGTTWFESQKNASIFKKFCSDLDTDLVENLSMAPNELVEVVFFEFIN